jgi:hypothetical protein
MAWSHVLTKFGFLAFQPVPASRAATEAALSLRHDAFEAELAGFGEHHCALGGERFAEQNSINAGDEPLERFAPHLERPQTLIVAIEAHKIEGDQRSLRAAALG